MQQGVTLAKAILKDGGREEGLRVLGQKDVRRRRVEEKELGLGSQEGGIRVSFLKQEDV